VQDWLSSAHTYFNSAFTCLCKTSNDPSISLYPIRTVSPHVSAVLSSLSHVISLLVPSPNSRLYSFNAHTASSPRPQSQAIDPWIFAWQQSSSLVIVSTPTVSTLACVIRPVRSPFLGLIAYCSSPVPSRPCSCDRLQPPSSIFAVFQA
jgi:hypothetical protein